MNPDLFISSAALSETARSRTRDRRHSRARMSKYRGNRWSHFGLPDQQLLSRKHARRAERAKRFPPNAAGPSTRDSRQTDPMASSATLEARGARRDLEVSPTGFRDEMARNSPAPASFTARAARGAEQAADLPGSPPRAAA